MMKLCLFMVNIIMLKTCVNAEAVADGQTWTHKDTVSGNNNGVKPGRNVISPRMDFDEWTPLGRGDPLKNDPTFDYLPPVLDKVHYWKPPPPASANRGGHPSSTVAPPPQTVNYNRRFFLTDFSRKEPTAAYVQYVHKRPQIATGYYHHYPMMAKTPLPMLTPPPYQRPTLQAAAATTVEPMDMTPSLQQDYAAGDSAAESKQPPAVRAPPPMSSVRPVLSHSVIKVLLENEVDRTTVTTSSTAPGTTGRITTTPTTSSSSTTAATTTAATTIVTPTTTRAPPTTDPLFRHYKQSAVVTGRPMYLIIQGHSKVKTYGLVSKSEDLSAAARPAHEHNHIGSQPDEEPSRRKRNNGGPALK